GGAGAGRSGATSATIPAPGSETGRYGARTRACIGRETWALIAFGEVEAVAVVEGGDGAGSVEDFGEGFGGDDLLAGAGGGDAACAEGEYVGDPGADFFD